MQDSTKSARASSFNGERLSERKATSGRKATNGRTTTPGRGCVKTSARFQTSLFRSLLRALERSESKNREKSCSARSFTNVEFLHGLGRFDRFATPTRMTAVCAHRTAGVDVKHPLRIAALGASIGRKATVGRMAGTDETTRPRGASRTGGKRTSGRAASLALAPVTPPAARPFERPRTRLTNSAYARSST